LASDRPGEVAFTEASIIPAPFVKVHGREGVNTVPSADAALDIGGGTTHGLRIRPTAAAGHPTTGTWYTGTLIVDSAGALFLCTQTGAPGQWKQVTP